MVVGSISTALARTTRKRGPLSATLQNVSANKKDSGRQRPLTYLAITEETKPREAEEHHRPGRGLGYRCLEADSVAICVGVEADHLAEVIDPVGRHGRAAERVDRAERAASIEEAEHVPVRERIVADYLTKALGVNDLWLGSISRPAR